MPDPFRHYEGVPVLDLPADPPSTHDGPSFLSWLLYHSAAISASKLVPSTGQRYALRVNPSSGNLHPTEFHFRTRGLAAWPDGLYHYRPSSHMAEQRALGSFAPDDRTAPIVFFLSSIVWREAWKYRERAYRYCLHDIGHAWQALALAARAMGCETAARGHFSDDDLAQTCRFHEDEWPMLIVELRGGAIPTAPAAAGQSETIWYGGQANTLSTETIAYPSIGEIHHATKTSAIVSPEPAAKGTGHIALPPPLPSTRPFAQIARQRRSALDFTGGERSISLEQLSAILTAAAQPLAAGFAAARFIQLYLYIHRVTGLDPGVYRYWPEPHRLELLQPGDQRLMAAGLSLGQDLAGNSCLAFSMIADLDRAARAFGPRAYRYVHVEAGAIGQHLYLAAESLGLGATGIGAFYDDEVHRHLSLSPEGGQQVVYHFAIGYPISDPRLEASVY
jgi:SagB-type dehydrogenase family enzyme